MPRRRDVLHRAVVRAAMSLVAYMVWIGRAGPAAVGARFVDNTRIADRPALALQPNSLMLNRIPRLRGATPWVLMDFRSPVRQLPGIQDGFKRKGLVSDQGKKKAAFLVLEEAYKENGLGHAE